MEAPDVATATSSYVDEADANICGRHMPGAQD